MLLKASESLLAELRCRQVSQLVFQAKDMIFKDDVYVAVLQVQSLLVF